MERGELKMGLLMLWGNFLYGYSLYHIETVDCLLRYEFEKSVGNVNVKRV